MAGLPDLNEARPTHRLPLAHRPKRVVAISGEYNRHVLRGQSGVDFFPKPVDLNQLLDTIGGLAH